MCRRAQMIPLAVALIIVGVSGACGRVSPYLYESRINLSQQKVFTSEVIEFSRTHWVAAVFAPADFQKISVQDIESLPVKARHSLASGKDLILVPFDESYRRGNTLPSNTMYLFAVVGPGKGQFTIDFSDVELPVSTFRVVVIKDVIELKDPRVKWK